MSSPPRKPPDSTVSKAIGTGSFDARRIGATGPTSNDAGVVVMSTTQPTEFLFHRISDAELDQLIHVKAFWETEIFLLCAGAAIGALVAFGSAILTYWWDYPNFKTDDLLNMLVFVGASVGAAVAFLIQRQKLKKQVDLPSEIRSRPKERVVLVDANRN